MIRRTLITAACIAALSLTAFADRFTDSLNSLEMRATEIAADLDPSTDKKPAKLLKGILKKLDKDSTALSKDIATTKKLVGPIGKLGLAELDGLLVGAVDGIRSDVFDAIDVAQQKLEAVVGKVTEEKVRKQINAARDLMERDFGESNLKKRLGLLKKAEARARKADKLADKFSGGGGGGGGGGNCEGTAAGAGDTLNVTQNGDPYGADNFSVITTTDAFGSRTTVTVVDCDNERVLSLTFPAPLATGMYFAGSIDPASSVSLFVGPTEGFGRITFDGEAEITSVSGGRLQLTFSLTLEALPGGPDRFAGAYVGTVNVPLN